MISRKQTFTARSHGRYLDHPQAYFFNADLKNPSVIRVIPLLPLKSQPDALNTLHIEQLGRNGSWLYVNIDNTIYCTQATTFSFLRWCH